MESNKEQIEQVCSEDLLILDASIKNASFYTSEGGRA